MYPSIYHARGSQLSRIRPRRDLSVAGGIDRTEYIACDRSQPVYHELSWALMCRRCQCACIITRIFCISFNYACGAMPLCVSDGTSHVTMRTTRLWHRTLYFAHSGAFCVSGETNGKCKNRRRHLLLKLLLLFIQCANVCNKNSIL